MDGGYYAIKGFEFQIDKTLIEALDSSDPNTGLFLEHIQDINNGDFVMQVKYKEASKLTPSTIREPIKQLIKEFQKDKSRKYILYCFFKDTNGYTENVDLALLDKILGKERGDFNANEKKSFLGNFELRFSETFQVQFQSVLDKLQMMSFCTSKDEAIYFYSILVDYLRKKVIKNPPGNIKGRQVTKNELIEYLNKGRRIIFLSSFKEYKGEQEYFKLLRSRFKKPIRNQHTLLYFGEILETESCSLPSLVYQLIEKHYNKATHDVKPLIFVVPSYNLFDIKKYLIQQNCPFNDGYESILFSQKHFESPAIINKKTLGGKTTNSLSKTSFKTRIISSETFDQLSEINLSVSWILIDSEEHDLIEGANYQVVKKLNTEQLLKLF